LHGLTASGYQTHAQFVCIGVLLGSQNFTDHDAAERGCRRSKTFEFETGERETLAERGGGAAWLYPFAQPGQGNLHGLAPVELAQEAQVVFEE
jgi:hypothetical protein